MILMNTVFDPILQKIKGQVVSSHQYNFVTSLMLWSREHDLAVFKEWLPTTKNVVNVEVHSSGI